MTARRPGEAIYLRRAVKEPVASLAVRVPGRRWWILEAVRGVYIVSGATTSLHIHLRATRMDRDVIIGRASWDNPEEAAYEMLFIRGIGRRATASLEDPWPAGDVVIEPGSTVTLALSTPTGTAKLSSVELALRRYHDAERQ